MSFRKGVPIVVFCLLLQAGTSLAKLRSEIEVTKPSAPKEFSNSVSRSQFGIVPGNPKVPTATVGLPYLPTSNTELTLMLPSNGKGNKHNNQGEDQGNWDNHAREPEQDHAGKSVSVQVVFGDRDGRIIREYCAQPSSSLPPGLAKRGQLPPGLEKQLRRNGQLPPGLQKKVQRFPVELERRLPPLPRNYVRVFVAGRGLIVDAQFNIVDIIDILR